ncbi:hypothetical protein KJ603_02355 [Patescibacteria group bacterium]|nr:hypothetical protein [Patescibacteria group bacterium]
MKIELKQWIKGKKTTIENTKNIMAIEDETHFCFDFPLSDYPKENTICVVPKDGTKAEWLDGFKTEIEIVGRFSKKERLGMSQNPKNWRHYLNPFFIVNQEILDLLLKFGEEHNLTNLIELVKKGNPHPDFPIKRF